MDQERRRRLMRLFHAALEREPSDGQRHVGARRASLLQVDGTLEVLARVRRRPSERLRHALLPAGEAEAVAELRGGTS